MKKKRKIAKKADIETETETEIETTIEVETEIKKTKIKTKTNTETKTTTKTESEPESELNLTKPKLSHNDDFIINNSDIEFGKRDECAEGAHAEIYYAKWHNKDVVIKSHYVAHKKTTENEITYLKLLMRLKAPHIVPYFGTATTETTINSVFGKMENGALDFYIKDNALFPWSWTIRYHCMHIIAEALDYLHANNIIHHDFKSSNILLDKEFNPKICDFGATMENGTENNLNLDFGSPGYAAPEAYTRSIASTFKLDIYGFAIIMLEISSWHDPYSYANDGMAIYAELKAGKRPKIPNDVPSLVKNLILLSWAQKPEDRPTATQLKEKLTKLDFDNAVNTCVADISALTLN